MTIDTQKHITSTNLLLSKAECKSDARDLTQVVNSTGKQLFQNDSQYNYLKFSELEKDSSVALTACKVALAVIGILALTVAAIGTITLICTAITALFKIATLVVLVFVCSLVTLAVLKGCKGHLDFPKQNEN